jgi:excisionase family DNA binding protein
MRRAASLAGSPARGRVSVIRPIERVPRLALRPDEAAASLGVSRDFFDEHVAPQLRTVRHGRLRMVPVRELERWLEREAALTLEARG